MAIPWIIALVLLANSAVAQVYCVRATGHTPHYERIFLAKGDALRSSATRGVDDLRPPTHYPETNRIDELFADVRRERTNGFYISCFTELPMNRVALRCPGGLLSQREVHSLLYHAVVVPKNSWTNHLAHAGGGRCVFSLIDPKGKDIVIDLRAGGCAVVFFPDDTFRCIMPGGYSCLNAAR